MTKNPDDDTGVTDEVNIIWSVPEDDGGYPITGLFNFMIKTYTVDNLSFLSITTMF